MGPGNTLRNQEALPTASPRARQRSNLSLICHSGCGLVPVPSTAVAAAAMKRPFPSFLGPRIGMSEGSVRPLCHHSGKNCWRRTTCAVRCCCLTNSAPVESWCTLTGVGTRPRTLSTSSPRWGQWWRRSRRRQINAERQDAAGMARARAKTSASAIVAGGGCPARRTWDEGVGVRSKEVYE